MAETRTGTISSLTASDPDFDGELIQDIDTTGPVLSIKDKNFPGTIQVGDRVTYTFNDGEVPSASDVTAMAPGPVITEPTTGNQNVGAGQSLTIVNTTLTGRINCSGGEVFLTGATVTNKVTVDEGGSITIDGGSTVNGKVTIDDANEATLRGGNNFNGNVAVSNVNSFAADGGNNFNGNVRVDGAGNATVNGNNFDGNDLQVDNSTNVTANGNNLAGSAGSMRIEMCANVEVDGNTGVNNIRVVGATSATINNNTCEGSIRAFTCGVVTANGNTLNNANTDKNTRIITSDCQAVSMNNNNLNNAVGKADDCIDVTMQGNTLTNNGNGKKTRLRVQTEAASTNVIISDNAMDHQNIRFLDENCDNVGFSPTSNVTIENNTDTGRVRIDGGNKATVRSCTSSLNGTGDNNVNIRIHKSTTATIDKCTAAGHIKLTENTSATCTNSSAGLNIIVKDNGDATITNNTATGDLKISGTTGTCSQSGNTFTNIEDCP